MLTFGPGFSTELTLRPVTTTALGFVHSLVAASPSQPPVLWWQHVQSAGTGRSPQGGKPGAGRSCVRFLMRMLASLKPSYPEAVNQGDFVRIGHSLLALLSGLLGGTVATWFHARRERSEAVVE